MPQDGSWSKPDGVPGLIARKQVDKSMFTYGSHIREAYYEYFALANSGHLPVVGESHEVILVEDDVPHEAKLTHHPRRDSGGARLELLYSQGGPFTRLLRRKLPYSYEHLVVQRDDRENYSPEAIPVDEREYVEFYETGDPYRYKVRFIPCLKARLGTGASSWSIPLTFTEVWLDLGRLLGARTVIHTLAQGVPNTVTWVEATGVQVTTEQGSDLLPKAWFEASWDSLVRNRIVAADNLPGEARYRSAVVSAILASLPHVEYTTYPKITLFLKTHQFTNAQISETFKVGQMRGIRVAGRSPDTRLVVFITGDDGVPNPDHPYHDRWQGERFFYTGEGLQGDQELTSGNLALKNNITKDFPVYGFRKLVAGGYAYLSRFKVRAVHEEQQKDQNGNPRNVYIFEMEPIGPTLSQRTEPPQPETQPNYRRVPAPANPEFWPIYKHTGQLRLDNWAPLGDLSAYPTPDNLKVAVMRETTPSCALEPLAEQLWAWRHLQPGDRLIVSRGPSTIVGLAEVVAPGYAWNDGHTVHVRWTWLGHRRIARQDHWHDTLINDISPELYDLVLNTESPQPTLDLAAIAQNFGAALRQGGVSFGPQHEDLVQSFVASLATKRLVILTGLSGSGKTQIALQFGNWLGKDRRKVVAVRPDWTGPDPLFGYPDALKTREDKKQVWYVPEVLAFMLKAIRDPDHPYLLILDEMNLAHVERYFADFLSGIESGEACLPNLIEDQGQWYIPAGADERLPMPENLFVVGTVNVDETTYMFSPKVLDRANTFEFRVETADLSPAGRKPVPCEPGDEALVRGFLAIAADETWHLQNPAEHLDPYVAHLRTLHELLSQDGFEFGHRVFYEAIRFAAMFRAAGNPDTDQALDRVVMQKILPRLHGTRRRLEDTLCALGRFCFDLTYNAGAERFSFEKLPEDAQPRLPVSFDKVHRMTRRLRANQFASFTE